jgi:hypothetical protein
MVEAMEVTRGNIQVDFVQRSVWDGYWAQHT